MGFEYTFAALGPSRRIGAVLAVGIVAVGLDVTGGQTMNVELDAAQISALNPLMVMIIIPLLNVRHLPAAEKRGYTVRPLQKMTVGMFLSALAFAVAAILQAGWRRRQQGQQLHVLWQVLQYLVMTTAEVLVSVTGLEFAYTQAPRKMNARSWDFGCSA